MEYTDKNLREHLMRQNDPPPPAHTVNAAVGPAPSNATRADAHPYEDHGSYASSDHHHAHNSSAGNRDVDQRVEYGYHRPSRSDRDYDRGRDRESLDSEELHDRDRDRRKPRGKKEHRYRDRQESYSGDERDQEHYSEREVGGGPRGYMKSDDYSESGGSSVSSEEGSRSRERDYGSRDNRRRRRRRRKEKKWREFHQTQQSPDHGDEDHKIRHEYSVIFPGDGRPDERERDEEEAMANRERDQDHEEGGQQMYRSASSTGGIGPNDYEAHRMDPSHQTGAPSDALRDRGDEQRGGSSSSSYQPPRLNINTGVEPSTSPQHHHQTPTSLKSISTPPAPAMIPGFRSPTQVRLFPMASPSSADAEIGGGIGNQHHKLGSKATSNGSGGSVRSSGIGLPGLNTVFRSETTDTNKDKPLQHLPTAVAAPGHDAGTRLVFQHHALEQQQRSPRVSPAKASAEQQNANVNDQNKQNQPQIVTLTMLQPPTSEEALGGHLRSGEAAIVAQSPLQKSGQPVAFGVFQASIDRANVSSSSSASVFQAHHNSGVQMHANGSSEQTRPTINFANPPTSLARLHTPGAGGDKTARRGTAFTLGNKKLTARLMRDQSEHTIAASMAMRKKKQALRTMRREQSQGLVHAYCICESIDLDSLNTAWNALDVENAQEVLNPIKDEYVELETAKRFHRPDDVVSVDPQVTYLKVLGGHDCFVFRFGTVVTWGITEEQTKEICEFCTRYGQSVLPEWEEDYMFFIEERGPPGSGYVAKDRITLSTKNAFERLAYSYAFGQSVKLVVFEEAVESSIERSKAIPEELMRTGKLPQRMTNQRVAQYMGDLFVQRCRVNLHFDILDTPDVFWDFDEFEHCYDKCRKYLDLSKRVNIVNQRLEIIKELYDMLHNEVTIKNEHNLEWIIIILIVLEVVFEVLGLCLQSGSDIHVTR